MDKILPQEQFTDDREGIPPQSTFILQTILSKEAVICYLRFLGIRSRISYRAPPLSYCHQEGQTKIPGTGNSRTRTHRALHNFQFLS